MGLMMLLSKVYWLEARGGDAHSMLRKEPPWKKNGCLKVCQDD